jgi:glycosyltransferase involved in cell wall biosynthesis
MVGGVMKFAFYSCMSGVNWGGSETLWSLAALRLMEQGHQVSVNFKWWPNQSSHLTELKRRGADLWLRETRIQGKLASSLLGGWRILRPSNGTNRDWLSRGRPDFLLITVGYHPDRVMIANQCHRIPYAINLQCASSSVFINSHRLQEFRDAYRNAAKVFVVSEENREKLEANLALRLDNVERVSNPFIVPWHTEASWPQGAELKLACVGRIHFASKGQDLLVQALRRPHWKDRAIKIAFVGKNQGNEEQLRDLIEMFGLQDKFVFEGFSNQIEDVWKRYHGLVLPSRYEGAALVVTEAMLCHRMVVCTDTGRNRELVDDNHTGFLAKSATADAIDEALNRAWHARDKWQGMGMQAGRDVRMRYAQDPVGDFQGRLQELAMQPQTPVNVETKPTRLQTGN